MSVIIRFQVQLVAAYTEMSQLTLSFMPIYDALYFETDPSKPENNP